MPSPQRKKAPTSRSWEWFSHRLVPSEEGELPKEGEQVAVLQGGGVWGGTRRFWAVGRAGSLSAGSGRQQVIFTGEHAKAMAAWLPLAPLGASSTQLEAWLDLRALRRRGHARWGASSAGAAAEAAAMEAAAATEKQAEAARAKAETAAVEAAEVARAGASVLDVTAQLLHLQQQPPPAAPPPLQ